MMTQKRQRRKENYGIKTKKKILPIRMLSPFAMSCVVYFIIFFAIILIIIKMFYFFCLQQLSLYMSMSLFCYLKDILIYKNKRNFWILCHFCDVDLKVVCFDLKKIVFICMTLTKSLRKLFL